jgi:hypothetical protein
MGLSSQRSGGEPAVNAVAVVSLVLGLASFIAPAAVGRVFGVGSSRRVLRSIGVVDLALAPGLFFGRPRWPWLMARAASNPMIAAVCVMNARSVRARLIAAGLIGATVLDLRTAARMRSSGL